MSEGTFPHVAAQMYTRGVALITQITHVRNMRKKTIYKLEMYPKDTDAPAWKLK